jgi:hypothetical protein
MSPLRKQMEADMAIRGLAYRTRETYVESVAKLAKFYGRGPDRISEAEVQRYLLHLLQERKLAHSSCNVMTSALEFFYRVTLKRRETEFRLPNTAPASSPKATITIPLALGRRVDRFAGICHSQPHPNRPATTLPSAPCPARYEPAPRSATTRGTRGRIQIPNAIALNPAVQSNKFYPPCCRTADKTLFVMPQ